MACPSMAGRPNAPRKKGAKELGNRFSKREKKTRKQLMGEEGWQ